jgi:hypothetical protein
MHSTDNVSFFEIVLKYGGPFAKDILGCIQQFTETVQLSTIVCFTVSCISIYGIKIYFLNYHNNKMFSNHMDKEIECAKIHEAGETARAQEETKRSQEETKRSQEETKRSQEETKRMLLEIIKIKLLQTQKQGISEVTTNPDPSN